MKQPIKVLKKEGDYLLLEQYGQTYIRYIGDGKPESIFQIRATSVERFDILNKELRMEYTVERRMKRTGQTVRDYQIRSIMDFLQFEGAYSVEESVRIVDELKDDVDIVNLPIT